MCRRSRRPARARLPPTSASRPGSRPARALRKIKQEGGKSREYANDDLRWFSGIKARLNLVSELLGGTRFYVEEASARGKKVLIMFKGGHWPHHGEMIFVRSEVDPVISQLSAPLEGLRKWDQEYGVGVIKAAEAEQARLRQVLADAHGYNTHGGKGNSVLFPEDFAALTAEINGLAADKELATAAGDVHQGPFGLSSDNLRVSGFWPEVRWISPHPYRQSPPELPMPRSRPRRQPDQRRQRQVGDSMRSRRPPTRRKSKKKRRRKKGRRGQQTNRMRSERWCGARRQLHHDRRSRRHWSGHGTGRHFAGLPQGGPPSGGQKPAGQPPGGQPGGGQGVAGPAGGAQAMPQGGQGGTPAGAPQGVAATGGQPGGGPSGPPQGMGAGSQAGAGPAGGAQAMPQGGQGGPQASAPQGMAAPGGQPGGGQSGPPQGMGAGSQAGTAPAGGAQAAPPGGQGGPQASAQQKHGCTRRTARGAALCPQPNRRRRKWR